MSQPRGSGRYGQSGGGQFGVIHKKSNLGAKLGTVFVLVLVFGGAGGSYYFYTDVPLQIRHLEAKDQLAVPAAIAQYLRGVDPPAVAPLRKGLASGRVPLKKACAKALGASKSPENTPFLGEAVLEDADASVRAAAMRAIGENGDVNCRRYMSVALEDSNDEVKIAAVEAVAKLRLDNFLLDLINFLSHPNSYLKNAARAALETWLQEGRSFGDDRAEWMKWYEGEYQ
jgi:HEAT repeat protein